MYIQQLINNTKIEEVAQSKIKFEKTDWNALLKRAKTAKERRSIEVTCRWNGNANLLEVKKQHPLVKACLSLALEYAKCKYQLKLISQGLASKNNIKIKELVDKKEDASNQLYKCIEKISKNQKLFEALAILSLTTNNSYAHLILMQYICLFDKGNNLKPVYAVNVELNYIIQKNI